MNSFSFSGNISRNILVYLGKILPGVVKIIGIYNSDLSEDTQIWVIDKVNNPSSLSLFDGSIDKDKLERFRSKRPGFDWITPGDEPYIDRSITKLDSDMWSELDKTILSLRVKPDEANKNCDVYFVSFEKSRSNIRLHKDDNILSQDSKVLLRSLLKHIIDEILYLWKNDRQELHKLINFSKRTIEDYKVELSIAQSQRVNYGIEAINRINSKSDTQFTFTDKAVDKIRNYTGCLWALGDMIAESAIYATMINPYSTVISIDESVLRLINKIPIENAAGKTKIYMKYADVATFLDNYEEAVKSLVDEGIEVKSELVGKRLKPKEISASTISSALKNRSSKIIYLMKNHREKWPHLRKYFRPMRNILQNEHDLLIEDIEIS